MQSRIIAFCYFYLVGIVVAMLALPGSEWLPVLRAATMVGAALYCALLAYRRLWKPGLSESRVHGRAEWALLLATAVALGITRHTTVNTIPDQRVGQIEVAGTEARFVENVPLPDVSRLLLRAAGPLEEDLVLRLHGEMDVRLPILEDGVATLDAEGRWRFRMATVSQTSEEILLRKTDPAGTMCAVPQEFSRVTSVEVVRGPAAAQLDVVRVSNHASAFVRVGRDSAPVTVLGRILADAMVYDFKTVLTVTPAYIQYRSGGPFYRVEGGDIRVTVPPGVDNYDEFAHTEAYGYDVQIRGSLFSSGVQPNPGGFDQRRFMSNHNLFGQMSLYQPEGEPTPIHAVAPPGQALRKGHPLVEFSLRLRDRMLFVFKQVMPFPHSAFLSAVTLGLRYGMHGVASPFDPERLIANEFQAAGINHVLAVSGLHVTILTALFMGIFSLLRIPRRFYAPVVILVLIIFAIITGARPSTLRAVIMNSLFLLVWAYMSQGLRASALFGVPVAAFLILLHNPRMIVDPSFTLSFGAILSLALLTGPVHEQFSKLRGNTFAAAIVVALLGTMVAMLRWPLAVEPRSFFPLAGVAAAIVWGARRLERRGILLVGRFGFSDIPPGISAFLSAQVAIQLGMMLPLSAYYFSRWAMAGAYANLPAIPLIGVIVQLGVLAGLLGLIPGIGIYLALLLSAANWFLSSVFIWIGYAGTEYFPFPFMRRPSVIELLIYYLLLAAFIWHRPIRTFIRGLCERFDWKHPWAPRAVMAACLVGVLMPAAIFPAAPRPDGLSITVLSVGYGRSVVVETPGGRRVLVDGGFVEYERGRRNEAQRSVLPFLALRHLRDFEAVVLTSPNPEESAGLPYVLNEIKARRLYVPAGLENVRRNWSFDTFLEQMEWPKPKSATEGAALRRMYEDLVGHPEHADQPSLARTLALRRDQWLNRWGGWVVEPRPLRAGDVLLEETVDGKPFRIEVLQPKDAPRSTALRIEYGDFAMLIAGDLHYEEQAALLSSTTSDRLRADVCLLPHHGAALPRLFRSGLRDAVLGELQRATGPLLDAVGAEVLVADYGFPRPVLGLPGRDAEGASAITEQFLESRYPEARVLNTGRDLAVYIRSDGTGYTIETQAERLRGRGGEGDAVTDLEVGF